MNVLALLGSTAVAQGSVQVLVDNVNKAKKALGGAGLSYTEGTLEQVELANKPGALAELAGKLAKKGINIDCAYATMPKGGEEGGRGARDFQDGRGRAGLSCRPCTAAVGGARVSQPESFSRLGAAPQRTPDFACSKGFRAVEAWAAPRTSPRPRP